MRRMKRYHVDESLHHTYHLGCLQWVVPRVTKLCRQVSGLYKAADAGGRRQPMRKGCEEKKNVKGYLCSYSSDSWFWFCLKVKPPAKNRRHISTWFACLKYISYKNPNFQKSTWIRKVRLSSELTSVTGYSLTDDNVQHLWVNHIFALTFFWHCCSCNSILSDILLISQSLL